MASMNTNKFLTIVIPTYNREKQLLRLLRSIERQNAIDKYYIVILNNHSDYDVEASIRDTFSGGFFSNIEIYNRPYNGGGDYNIASAFLFAKTDYLWIIGDDDEVVDGSIDIITKDVDTYPECPLFKYHIKNQSHFKEDVFVKGINDFKKLYRQKYFVAGDVIFLSNNIYNLAKLDDYISTALYYSYCSIPHVLPMLRCLIDERLYLLSHNEIIKYNNPEGDHWNYIKISTSLSSILDINYCDRYDVVCDFFSIISKHFELSQFLEECLKIGDKRYRNYICTKGMKFVFRKERIRKSFIYLLYLFEDSTNIKVLTKYYKSFLNYKMYLKKKNSFIYVIYRKIKEV